MSKLLATRSITSEERVFNVNRMYCQGKSLAQIAKQLGLSMHTVHDDLAAARQLWAIKTQDQRAVWVARELERLEAIEHEAWNEWFRSTKPARETREENSEHPKTTNTKRGRIGDARLLAVILKCIERRCQLLGLDAPQATAEDLDREFSEPLVLTVDTRDAARIVMSSQDGRVAVNVSDAAPSAVTAADKATAVSATVTDAAPLATVTPSAPDDHTAEPI